VDALNAGARAEQIAVLEAQVAQAKSGLSSLVQQREMFNLTAPLSGVVIVAEVQPGEVAAAGAPLVTIADLTDLTLTVYVPENRLSEVQLGQIVTATVNSVADRTFSGVVQHIASQAEFTPRNVATQEERVNLVFAVDIQLFNPGRLLKPGMAADVEFHTPESLSAEGGQR
jgi:HlyD family secretion protein